MSNSNLKIFISLFAIAIFGAGYYYRNDIESYIYKDYIKMECSVICDSIDLNINIYNAIKSNVVADEIIISFKIDSKEQISAIIKSTSMITFEQIQALIQNNNISAVDMVTVTFVFGMQKIQHFFKVIMNNNVPYKLQDSNGNLITIIKMKYDIYHQSIKLNVAPDSITMFLKDNPCSGEQVATLGNKQNISMAEILDLLSECFRKNPHNKWQIMTLYFKFADQAIECPFEILRKTDNSDHYYEICNREHDFIRGFK